jgi:tetratricopeptide (TPR) repeat protein
MSFELGNYEQSITYFNDYLRIYGDNAQVRAYRGNAYYEEKEYQKAYLSYKKSLRLSSDRLVQENLLKAKAQQLKN